jgi:superfamily II DNA or RNA helicase
LTNLKLHIPEYVKLRPYQHLAYKNWKNNNYSGIFAMATGTGKTITSINCVYEEYLSALTHSGKGEYHVLVLVPTQPLLHQWARELATWGMTSIYRVSGDYNWRKEIKELLTDQLFGLPIDFAIVATYRSFANAEFIALLSQLPNDIILIADEAHNVGQAQVQARINSVNFGKKIGLSATPKRIYDPEGTAALERFFNDSPPYCFSLYMDEAIATGSLCKYDYFPRLVELKDEELAKYVELSLKIAKLSGQKDEANASIIEALLLKRKRIVNKARNKLSVLADIIKEIKKREPLKYCFTYAPGGDTEDAQRQTELDNVRLIRQMQKVIEENSPGIRTHAYLGETEDRETVLKNFESGQIDLLLAINCLDEGVDVPRTGIGIFTSSTGNPRQFIQRRGRLLRKHKDKSRALIYDMVVIPRVFAGGGETNDFRIQRSLVKNELMRVGYFAKLSENFYEAREALESVCEYYKLDLDTIIKELENES